MTLLNCMSEDNVAGATEKFLLRTLSFNASGRWTKTFFPPFSEARAEIVGPTLKYLTPGSTLKLICKVLQSTEATAYIFWYHDNRMINYDLDRGINVSSEAGKHSFMTVNGSLSKTSPLFRTQNSIFQTSTTASLQSCTPRRTIRGTTRAFHLTHSQRRWWFTFLKVGASSSS